VKAGDSHTIRSSFPALLSAALAMLLYAVTLGGTYVYDDIVIVQQDPRGASPRLWTQYWTKDYFNGGLDNLYRPLVSTSYGVERWLHGDRPWIYHLINCLLHAGVAAAVAEFTRRATKRTAAATIAGLLFAAHPVHVEVVANIVGRAESACALAIFAVLILFARRPLTPARVAAIVICQIIAVLCKEQGILLPAMLAIYGWLVWRSDPLLRYSGGGLGRGFAQSDEILLTNPHPDPPPECRRRGRSDDERAALMWLIICITWSTSAYLVLREHFLRFEWDRSFLDWILQPMVRCSPRDRWLMPLVLLGHYTQLLVFPIKPSPDYGATVIGWIVRIGDPYLWLGVATVIGWIAALVVALRRRAGFVAFCLLCLALSYGMIGNIIALLGANLAERWIYLPSAFFLMIVGLWLARLPRAVCVTVMIVLLSLASVRTVTYAWRWNDRLRLYSQSLDEQPASAQLYMLTAGELDARGDLVAAEAVMDRAAKAFPDSWEVWSRRAMVAMDDGRFDDAAQYLRTAFELNPNPSLIGITERLERMRAAAKQNPATRGAR
jgi:hypothetical protein